jgi:hypothetical protein
MFGTNKHVVLDFATKIPLNLLSRTPFHVIITTKFVPLNLKGNPPKPPRGATVEVVQPIVPYSMPFMKPLNYPQYMNDFDLNVHV